MDYFIEYLPRLMTVQIVIKVDCSRKETIKFAKNSISTYHGSEQQTQATITWEPSCFPSIWTKTLSNLKLSNSELSARFKAGNEFNNIQLKQFLMSEEQRILNIANEDHDDPDESSIKIICQFCKCELLQKKYGDKFETRAYIVMLIDTPYPN